MQGKLRTTAMASYTVHEIQTASGTVVREYVSLPGTSASGTSAGKVFAIGWKGPWPPDMRQVLAVTSISMCRRLRQRAVRWAKAVGDRRAGAGDERGGTSAGICGRAYVPEMLPAGVRAEDIQ